MGPLGVYERQLRDGRLSWGFKGGERRGGVMLSSGEDGGLYT